MTASIPADVRNRLRGVDIVASWYMGRDQGTIESAYAGGPAIRAIVHPFTFATLAADGDPIHELDLITEAIVRRADARADALIARLRREGADDRLAAAVLDLGRVARSLASRIREAAR